MPGGLEIFLVYSNIFFSKPGRLRKLVKINLSCYQLFHFVLREGAKFIETGAGHSGTGAVTFFNTVNHGALTFFHPENHGA